MSQPAQAAPGALAQSPSTPDQIAKAVNETLDRSLSMLTEQQRSGVDAGYIAGIREALASEPAATGSRAEAAGMAEPGGSA